MKDFCSEALKLTNDSLNFATVNGMSITEARLGYAAGELRVQPESRNPMGGIHGGCLVTLADAVCAVASRTYGQLTVTLDMSMNYLAGGKGSVIRCEGHVVRKGRTTAVVRADLFDEDGTVIAVGTYTFYVKDQPLA